MWYLFQKMYFGSQVTSKHPFIVFFFSRVNNTIQEQRAFKEEMSCKEEMQSVAIDRIVFKTAAF